MLAPVQARGDVGEYWTAGIKAMVDPLQFQTMVELSFGDRAPRCGGCGVDDPDQPDQASPSELDLIKHADQCADRPKMSVEAQRCGVHPFAPSPHIFVNPVDHPRCS